jgi:fused signal recognition particle receptor
MGAIIAWGRMQRMDAALVYVALIVVVLALIVVVSIALVRRGRHFADQPVERPSAPRPGIDYAPGVGDDDSEPRDTPRATIETELVSGLLSAPESDVTEFEATELEALTLDVPAPATGRMERLRARLSRSNTAFGKGLLGLLSRSELDEATWDEIEETLLTADLGVAATGELMTNLRSRLQIAGAGADVSAILRDELLALVDPSLDRSLVTKVDGRPAVILVVGVNGTGKTTTTGKLARLLVAEDRAVVLAAADTFRAAAADQLQTWGDRVGAAVVRGPEGGDPASVAFDAVNLGLAADVDTVVIDTAGRLHTKTGLMDELGKVKRVIEKQSPVDEVLLVLDATTGQNGLVQAKVFAEVVAVTGIVLTKLDGTARGGIVVSVQRELGVPVKLVGLGEGPDDLAQFDPIAFVEALIAR